MIRYEVSTVIARPAEEVFYEVLDAPRYHEWMPGVVEAGYRTSGEPRAGHKGYEVRFFYGARVESQFELVRVDPPRCVAMTFASGRTVGGTATLTFDQEGGRTRVRSMAEVEGTALLTRIEPLGRWLFRRLDERTLEQLKRRLGG